MEGDNIKGATVLSGAVAFLLIRFAPESSFTWVASLGLWLQHFTWWQVWLGVFIVTLFHVPIFSIIGKTGQTSLMLGGNIALTLRDYLAKMKLMTFWKKKKPSIHGDADFMGWWEQWRYYFNARNTGWAIGNNCIPDGGKVGKDLTLGGLIGVGGMGTGKSAGLIITSLFRFVLDGKKNIFVLDPSGKTYNQTASIAQSLGYRTYRLSTLPESVPYSLRFNPLMWAESVSDCGILAKKIIGFQKGESSNSTANFFLNRATTLLTAVLVATWKQAPEYRNLPNAFRLLLHYASDKKVFSQVIEAALAEEENLRLQWCGLNAEGGNEKELGSVISTAETALAFAGDPTMAYILSGDEFDLNALRDEKMVFYNQFNETDEYFTPVNALLLSYCFDKALSGVEVSEGKYRGIRFMLDELYCLPKLPLAKVVANGRKYDCGVLACFQGFDQLQNRYKDEANAVLDGFKSKVFFKGLKPEYYEQLQKVLGTKTVEDDGKKYAKPLISIEEMEQMKKKEAILKLDALPAIRTHMAYYYLKDSRYYKLAQQAQKIEEKARNISDVAYLPFDEPIENDIETKIVTKQKNTSDELGGTQNVGHESDSDLQG